MKKRLSRQEEFEIMKLVLDKFLWVGVAIMVYGLFRIFEHTESTGYGFAIILAGAVILGLFVFMLVKEYEIVR